jgi:hypothetical protein
LGVTQKWPYKLEYRGRDPKENPDRLGKKGRRKFLGKDELNGAE